MNTEVELQLKNAQLLTLQIINLNEEVNNDNFIEHNLVRLVLAEIYSNISENLRENYSFNQFKDDLIKLFEKKEPSKALALDRLESWLGMSQRNSPENRFDSYKKYLIKEGKGGMISQLDADTYFILDKCHNPKELGAEWDRRGLVYGNVQSGKTANYIGLINRAFDAGYQIVIVFTGMTEDLRSQTQRRIDEGVVGQRGQEKIGIGEEPNFPSESIKSATTLTDDLSRKNSDILASIISTNEKSIWIVKKNKTVLENLILWLDKQRSVGKKIHGVPFLVIDDEADNASIQSLSKKDYEIWGEGQRIADLDLEDLTEDQEMVLNEAKERIIKAINRNIRVALSLMSHKTFVAYTATPYSIINQSEKDLERSVIIDDKKFNIDSNSDLFPEHFIIPITAGSNYLGIENIFNTEIEKRIPVLVNLNEKYPLEDLENEYFTSKRGEKYSFEVIPISLEDAILHFIISIIVRKYRGQKDYNTLLVHTSHLTENADYVAFKIEQFLRKLKDNLPGDNGGYLKRIETIFKEVKLNSKNKIFKDYFDRDYSFPESITKQNVLDVLESKMNADFEYVYAPLDVVSYHSSKNQELKHKNWTLDYNLKDTNGKRYKNYIVIGGNRLSRGLTLNGLTTSYFVRNSTRQDSLYQMARWFGYRENYEDLVRVFLPVDQINWFEGIYKLEKELRKDFIENNEEDDILLPKDAVIKMALHTPDDMHINKKSLKKFPSICDPNKLRNTRRQLMTRSGTTKTNWIINDYSIQSKNMSVIKNLIGNVIQDNRVQLFDAQKSEIDEIKYNTNSNFRNVHYQHIIDVLVSYHPEEKIKMEFDTLLSYIKANCNELDNWSLVIVNKGNDADIITEFKKCFYKDGSEISTEFKFIRRDKSAEIEGGSIRFKSILDQQKDNLFDVIDETNIQEYRENKKSEVIKKYRNQHKIPILLVFLAKTDVAQELGVFPLLYFFVPILENAAKVNYIIRN
jgi:hypothetical protein